MSNNKYIKVFVISTIVVSFTLKLILIYKYKNLLSLNSDDLNYIKSAVVLMKTGIFTFHNFNEPTVFIMPLYPAFLSAVFKVLGYGLVGMQTVRILQAVISCITILLVFFIGKFYFNEKVAAMAAFFVAFYFPNIVSVGYILTETLFTMLLCLLIYLSLIFCRNPSYIKFIVLGTTWTLATLCRPTIALYPILLFFYIMMYLKMDMIKAVKYGGVMLAVFIAFMLPWWVRNYQEYGEFVSLAASSGNPMLQGTYVGYRQTPENIVYYKLGKNSFETNKVEMAVAKQRIQSELKKDFWGYLKWFTIGKSYYLWCKVFYWKIFFGISGYDIQPSHYFIIVSGFLGMLILFFKNMFRYILPISVILYFNVVHCAYMAFDRYAFPLLPLVSIFSAYLTYGIFSLMKSAVLSVSKVSN